MAIQKAEFYEGAALHQLVRGHGLVGLRYDAPFFVLNEAVVLHLKYSTKPRSPWSFTFMPEEQAILRARADRDQVVLGLVCGGDGIAALPYEDLCTVAAPRPLAVRVSCRRHHAKHYSVSGPDGDLGRKLAPSAWRRLLNGVIS